MKHSLMYNTKMHSKRHLTVIYILFQQVFNEVVTCRMGFAVIPSVHRFAKEPTEHNDRFSRSHAPAWECINPINTFNLL